MACEHSYRTTARVVNMPIFKLQTGSVRTLVFFEPTFRGQFLIRLILSN